MDMVDFKLIKPINVGNLGFSDGKHLKNFIKYCYGAKSGRHVINERTKDNTLIFDDGSSGSIAFTADPIEQYNGIVGKLGDTMDDAYELFRNDVVYMPFIALIEDELISNFASFGEQDIHQYKELLSLFADGEIGFENFINSLAEEHGKKITDYKDIAGKKQLLLEHSLHTAAFNAFPLENIFFSISHGDQDEHHPDYHIHRVYIEE